MLNPGQNMGGLDDARGGHEKGLRTIANQVGEWGNESSSSSISKYLKMIEAKRRAPPPRAMAVDYFTDTCFGCLRHVGTHKGKEIDYIEAE
jgi:hypothetical protein